MMVSVTGKNIFKNGLIWLLFTMAKPLPPCFIKNLLYRSGGAKIGKRVWISPYATIDPVAPNRIILEDDVMIGWGATILSHEMNQDPIEGPRSREYKEDDTLLKRGCFIGGFTTVRCGVTVREGAVVGSNSLVVDNVPPGTLSLGVPAKVVKRGGDQKS
jgi:acetyltransferase-like isoleucine patch superfamily enzyme